MESNFWIYVGIGAIGLLALVYWLMRPVHWSDGEGVGGRDNPLEDTDVGSFRWAFMRGEGREFGLLLNLRDWWENERRRWRR